MVKISGKLIDLKNAQRSVKNKNRKGPELGTQ